MGFEVAYDPEENIKIVKAIKEHPVLYDTRNYPPIEFRGVSDETWTIVAEKCGLSEGNIRQRWTNIRGCFKRYLRNKARRKNTKNYYLADYLKFMEPFTKIDYKFTKTKVQTTIQDEDHFFNGVSDEISNSEEFQVSLVDSDGEEESYFISTNANTSDVVTVPETGSNPDWDFLSSLLPDVRKMNSRQKVTFRNAVLGAVDMALYGEELLE